ncbi:RHS repeat-associated core domain-containing protein [Vallitalea okinawensis]|uniref:RHS repeat-associated core domain-containing protein n=1 Tax=Vallitalea okinawensis TaxID=2078660 RepID=UPI000CFB1EA0|nr:RHS repeat-associated core domain-containing protein [Vallitalea okinawensis]
MDQTKYIFNMSGQLTEIKDRNNNNIILSYSSDKLTSIAGSDATLTLFYTGSKLSALTDHAGRKIEYKYNSSNELIEVKNLGGTVKYTYNNDGITSITDEKGITFIRNIYDDFGRVIEQEDEQGRITRYEYSEANLVNTHIVEGTNTRVKYYYNSHMYITKKEWEDGIYESYTYDDQGNKTSIRDRNGNITNYSYDTRGNIIEITAPSPFNYKTKYTYDSFNNITKVESPDGGITEFVYDTKGNLKTIKQKLDTSTYAETNYSYDSDGRVLSIEDPEGHIRSFEYDLNATKPKKETREDGTVVNYQYDSLDRAITIETAYGTTSFDYDNNNNIIKITDPQGNMTRMFYDGVGNLIKQVMPEQYNSTSDDGSGFEYRYDGFDRLVKKIDPLGNVYRSFYNHANNKTKEINPNNYNSSMDNGTGYNFEYDGSGRLTRVTLPSGEQKKIIYDGNGNVIKTIEANQYNEGSDTGAGYTYQYDELNRLKQVNDAKGNPVIRYVYDEVGRVIKVMDADGIASASSDTSRYGTIYQYNLAGWLVERREPSKKEGSTVYYSITEYTYNKKGQVLTEKVSQEHVTLTSYPTNYNTIQFAYDNMGRVTSITDTSGSEMMYQYDDMGKVIEQKIKINDSIYNITGFEYDTLGRIKRQWIEVNASDLDGDYSGTVNTYTSYEYDKNGNVIKTISPEGYVTTFEYDDNNRLITINEEVEASTLEQNRNVITIESPYLTAYPGQTYNYELKVDTEDELNYLTARLSYDPRVMEVVSTSSSMVNMDTSTLGIIVVSGSNLSENNVTIGSINIKMKDSISGTAYLQFTELPTYTTGSESKNFTEAIGKAVSLKAPDLNNDGSVQVNDLTLDALDVGLTSNQGSFNYGVDIIPDGNIDTTDLDYIKDWIFEDKSNNLNHVTSDYFQPKLVDLDYSVNKTTVIRTTHFEYDKAGNLVKGTDTNGNTVNYSYDDENRLIKVIDKEGNITRTFYDLNGNVSKEVMPENYNPSTDDGNGMTYTYDDNNRLDTVTNELGQVIQRYVYNDKGNIKKLIDANGHAIQYSYDIGNRVTEIITPEADGKSSIRYTYDANGNILTVIDNEDNATTYVRDIWGRATEVTNAKGITEYYSYDNAGNIISTTDGEGNTTNYTYNSLNKIKTMTDPEGNTITYHYDLEGRLTKEEDRKGQVIQYTYNKDSSLTNKVNTIIGEEEKYLYSKDGSLLAAINKESIKSFSYTENGTVDSISHNKVTELNYVYNKNGQIISLTDQTGKATNYTYDVLGRMDTVSTDGQEVANYIYNPDSTIQSISYANGVVTTYSFDQDKNITGLVTKKQEEIIDEYSYSYDLNGNLLQENRSGDITKYVYDELNRLSTVTYPDAKVETFTYDGANNRTERRMGEEVTIYTYNDLNQLTGLDIDGIITTYNYDLNGNLLTETKDGQTSNFTYNGFNQLTKAKLADGSWTENHYDALGLRTSITENGLVTNFIVSGGSTILETNEAGVIKSREVYGYGHLAKQGITGDMNYYHSNAHGDITTLTSQQGTVANRYTYDAFGNTTSAIEKVINRYQYAGEQYDDVTGYYYLRARYYNPTIGRFTQEDSYRRDGLNLYVYVGNNPLKFVDPSGHYGVGLDSNGDEVIISSSNGYTSPKVNKPVSDSQNKNEINIEKNGNDKAEISEITMNWSNYNNSGTLIDTVNNGVDAAALVGQEIIPKVIENSTKPSNIGPGTWNKMVGQQIDEVTSSLSSVNKGTAIVNIVLVAIDAGGNINNNVEQGVDTNRIITDATVDVAVGGGAILASTEAGALAGSIVPVYGNLVGAGVGFVVGIGYTVVTDVVEIDGKTVEDHMKDGLDAVVDEITKDDEVNKIIIELLPYRPIY